MSNDASKMAGNEAKSETRMTLEDAWQRAGEFGLNADMVKKRFRLQRRLILALGVLATALALFYEQVINIQPHTWNINGTIISVNTLVRYIVILLPITVSILLSYANKFTRGLNWVLLRNSAEAMKSEIFLFRAKAGKYSAEATLMGDSREIRLATMIKSIAERLMKTEVNQSGLIPYKGELPSYKSNGDDGFSFMDANSYVALRLEDQLNWYKKRTVELDRDIRKNNVWILVFGGLGTALAAFGLEVWIAVTTAIVGAFTTYLEFNQLENTLTSYNQASTDLQGVRTWWRALPTEKKNTEENFHTLVENSEKVMQAEANRWVQEMKDALSKLYEEDQESIAKLKEQAMTVPKDITPEELAQAFGLTEGEVEVIRDEVPTEIIESSKPGKEAKLAFTDPKSFFEQVTDEKEENGKLPHEEVPTDSEADPLEDILADE